MFCYQCEQTAGCSGCKGKQGVCGKSDAVAQLQDTLTGALIGLAQAAGEEKTSPQTDRLMIEGLFATLTNVNFDEEALKELIQKVQKEKATADYAMEKLWKEPEEDIRSLKSLLLFGIRGIAAYAYHAMVLGYTDETVNRFLYKGMAAAGQEKTMEALLEIVMEAGAVHLK